MCSSDLCISRLRRLSQSQSISFANSDGELIGSNKTESELWYILDSCDDHVSILHSNKDLIDFLEQARREGSDVFRAVARLDPALS